ncbi:MAG TPA: phosphate acetyltransferase, partial [Ruminococcaceae bacterium]|nr:phosphate acetyltransferase [Oscillospiraceae bacterium]
MAMFDKLLANLKASKKTIVFTEGTDARILSAAERLLKEDLMGVILCGNPDEVKKAAADGGFDVSAATVIDPLNYDDFEEMVKTMAELRKGK